LTARSEGVVFGPRVWQELFAGSTEYSIMKLALLFFPVLLGAQSFDAASIKRVQPAPNYGKGDPDAVITISPGNLVMRGASLKDMIQVAYSVKEYQLTGAGLSGDRYDLSAKAAAADPTQIRLMLQTMLEDRFKLKIHRDSKEMTVAAMVIGKGSKLGAAKPEGTPRTGIEGSKLTFENYSMSKLADYLSQHSAGLPIIDTTKIDGYYDFAVSLVDAASGDPGDVKRAIGQATRDGSFAKMIAEGIGMKLETRKGPLEMIVVDSAEKSPTEN
jgi:uncharacterized protein (TIGR03435 family)